MFGELELVRIVRRSGLQAVTLEHGPARGQDIVKRVIDPIHAVHRCAGVEAQGVPLIGIADELPSGAVEFPEGSEQDG